MSSGMKTTSRVGRKGEMENCGGRAEEDAVGEVRDQPEKGR